MTTHSPGGYRFPSSPYRLFSFRKLYQHWQCRAAQHLISHAAEQQPRQATAAMRGHGDQIGLLAARLVEDQRSQLLPEQRAGMDKSALHTQPAGDSIEVGLRLG